MILIYNKYLETNYSLWILKIKDKQIKKKFNKEIISFQLDYESFAENLKKLSIKPDVVFDYDDIIGLCEFMIRDRRYIEAYCCVRATVWIYSNLVADGKRDNFQSASKISKMLGMELAIFAEVTSVLLVY